METASLASLANGETGITLSLVTSIFLITPLITTLGPIILASLTTVVVALVGLVLVVFASRVTSRVIISGTLPVSVVVVSIVLVVIVAVILVVAVVLIGVGVTLALAACVRVRICAVLRTIVVLCAIVVLAIVALLSSVVGLAIVVLIATIVVVVVVVVVAAISTGNLSDCVLRVITDSEIDGIIKRTVLGDRDQARLVVPGRINRRKFVSTCREALVDGSSKDTVVSLVVQAFEEGEHIGVRRLRRVDRVDFLNHDVGVAGDLPLVVELLGRSEIVLVGISEKTSFHAFDSHLDGERLVFLDVV